MAFTYSGDPSASPLDEVRFLIGDTDVTDPQLLDGEINYNLKLIYGLNPPASGNFLPAAHCADAIAAKYTRAAESKAVGDLSISFAQRVKQYRDLGAKLRQRATLAGVPIFSGGISRAEKEGNYQDTDLTPAGIRIDGMNGANPIAATDMGDVTVGP